MIPERRLERAERLLMLVIKAGYRERREWRQQSREQNEKINILINAQIKTEEEHKRFQGDLDRLEANQEGLQANQEGLQASLKAFLDSMARGRNGQSSD